MAEEKTELDKLIQKFIEENHIKITNDDPICAVFTMLQFFAQQNAATQAQLLNEFAEKIQSNLQKIDELSINKSKKLIQTTWETTDEKIQNSLEIYTKNIENASERTSTSIAKITQKTKYVAYFNIVASIITFLSAVILAAKFF